MQRVRAGISFDFPHKTELNVPYVCVFQPTVTDCLQFDCFEDPLLVVGCAGLPADLGLEQSVDQR